MAPSFPSFLDLPQIASLGPLFRKSFGPVHEVREEFEGRRGGGCERKPCISARRPGSLLPVPCTSTHRRRVLGASTRDTLLLGQGCDGSGGTTRVLGGRANWSEHGIAVNEMSFPSLGNAICHIFLSSPPPRSQRFCLLMRTYEEGS